MSHKKVLVALPPGLLEQIDIIAQCEHRTRSDLVREALRRYVDSFKRSHGPRLAAPKIIPIDEPIQDVIFDGIAQAKKTKEFEESIVDDMVVDAAEYSEKASTAWEEIPVFVEAPFAGEVVTRKLELV